MPRIAAVLTLLVTVTACGSSGIQDPPEDPPALDPQLTRVSIDQALLLPGDTARVTLQARDADDRPLVLEDATVVFSAQGGSSTGAFLAVEDHGDGTHSADFVGADIGSPLTITATVNGQVITSALPAVRVVGFTGIATAGATQVGEQTTTTGGFTCGVITTGDMYCWGISWFGIRGNGTPGTIEPGLEPTLVGGGLRWTDVTAGRYFVCGLAVGGAAYCWGDGDVGELGNGASGSPPDVTVPAPVSSDQSFRLLSAAPAGGVCGVTLGSAALCWGTGTWGRLGNGDEAVSAVPVPVQGGLAFDALGAAFSATCGVAAGRAYCWGYEMALGLGGAPAPDTCAGSIPCAKSPVAVSGGRTFRSIVATDGAVACAVATDDQTYCWGSGYLGNGTLGTSSVPTMVSGGIAFTSLSAGEGYHCGTTADGAAYCWGGNNHGRLGNGTTVEALVPTPVSGALEFSRMSISLDHACGVTTEGLAYCWGGNDKGELGTRSQTASLTPSRVRLFTPR